MKKLSPRLVAAFESALHETGTPTAQHTESLKWLRYYLDFCSKYDEPPRDTDSLEPFLQKLASKRQTPAQQERAAASVQIYYTLMREWKETKEADNQLHDNDNTWETCFQELKKEILLRHYSKSTLKTYRSGAANISFVRQNLCPLSFVDVSQDDYVRATLGVYELNRVEYLRDVFAWAYGRSCAPYSAIRETLGEPDPFRLRYRQSLRGVIAEVVRRGHSKTVAVPYIRDYAAGNIPEDDRSRFVEVAETELMALHEGNIARYRLRPSEFSAWQDAWRS